MKSLLRNTEVLLHIFITAGISLLGTRLLLTDMYYPAVIILATCILTVNIATRWKKLKLYPRDARLSCYYLEGFSLLVSWATYHSNGNESLARISLIAAILLPFIGYISSLKTYRNKKRTA
nr:hypothetical protein [uncultured Flavobacterium sp.]